MDRFDLRGEGGDTLKDSFDRVLLFDVSFFWIGLRGFFSTVVTFAGALVAGAGSSVGIGVADLTST